MESLIFFVPHKKKYNKINNRSVIIIKIIIQQNKNKYYNQLEFFKTYTIIYVLKLLSKIQQYKNCKVKITLERKPRETIYFI